MQGISLLITPATILSPIYPNLWMCLVRDSGLYIFLTQILIWSYSVAVLSQHYLAWIQDTELHAHFCPISWLFSIPPVPYSLPDPGSCPTNDMSDPFWQPVGSITVCCHIFKQQVHLHHVLICLCHKGLWAVPA